MEPYDVVQRSLSTKHSTIMPVTADPVLRQQARAARIAAIKERSDEAIAAQGDNMLVNGTRYWTQRISASDVPWLLEQLAESDARVAAAQAETAEQIAQAIELRKGSTYDADPEQVGWYDAMERAAALARSVPGTSEGQSDG
jgi:TfoX/Sxy family transcriptional regulator of competence genes